MSRSISKLNQKPTSSSNRVHLLVIFLFVGIGLVAFSLMLLYNSNGSSSSSTSTTSSSTLPPSSSSFSIYHQSLSEIASKLKKDSDSLQIPRISCLYQAKPTHEEISRCPEDDLYLALWRLRNPEKKRWNIVNVGSNKGYSLAQFCDALNVRPFTKQHLAIHLFNYAEEKKLAIDTNLRWSLGGVCCDAVEKSVWQDPRVLNNVWFQKRVHDEAFDPSIVDPGFDVRIWGVDATKAHIAYTTEYFDKFLSEAKTAAKQPKTSIKFDFKRIAISNKKGVVKFPQPPLGVELGAMLPDVYTNDRKTSDVNHIELKKAFWKLTNTTVEDVNMTTLNDFLPSHVDQIDVLLTDTEGFDFDVHAGGVERFFSKGKVGIYVLELQPGATNIGTRTLGSFVKDMSQWGFECFFPIYGKDGVANTRSVANITFDPDAKYNCWNDEKSYNELRGWFNMICAGTKRNPELRDVFAELMRVPTNREFRTCSKSLLKKEFFDLYPGKVNSAWMDGLK